MVGALIERSWIDIADKKLRYIAAFDEFADVLDVVLTSGDIGLVPVKEMVETRGLEPLTFALRTRRSPN